MALPIAADLFTVVAPAALLTDVSLVFIYYRSVTCDHYTLAKQKKGLYRNAYKITHKVLFLSFL